MYGCFDSIQDKPAIFRRDLYNACFHVGREFCCGTNLTVCAERLGCLPPSLLWTDEDADTVCFVHGDK
jgi:hypothetical protein